MIDSVDDDNTGEIEFEEFLVIMKAIKNGESQGVKGQSSLYQFFQDMVEGNFSKRGDMDNDVPFMLNFSQYRRKRIIDAIILEDNLDEDDKDEDEDVDEHGYKKSPGDKGQKEAIKAKRLEKARDRKKKGQRILNVSFFNFFLNFFLEF